MTNSRTNRNLRNKHMWRVALGVGLFLRNSLEQPRTAWRYVALHSHNMPGWTVVKKNLGDGEHSGIPKGGAHKGGWEFENPRFFYGLSPKLLSHPGPLKKVRRARYVGTGLYRWLCPTKAITAGSLRPYKHSFEPLAFWVLMICTLK